jgi:hypothetical protein
MGCLTVKGSRRHAKSAAKIVAYCVWFLIVLCMSLVAIWPLELANKYLIGIFHISFEHPYLRIMAGLMIWLSFILLLLWLPVWLMRWRRWLSWRLMARTAAFVTSLLVCTVLCTIIWQMFITDRLYNCTDPAWLDYLFPGNWVHGKIEYVPVVTAGRSMSEPDTIKAGWSITGLWLLWLLFFLPSLIVSVLATRLFRQPRRPAALPDEQTV